MKTFTKPQNLNGTELMAELAAVGLIVDKVFDFSDGTIGFETDNEATALAVVAAHKGTIIAPERTVADKLASVNLTVNDLKLALGL